MLVGFPAETCWKLAFKPGSVIEGVLRANTQVRKGELAWTVTTEASSLIQGLQSCNTLQICHFWQQGVWAFWNLQMSNLRMLAAQGGHGWGSFLSLQKIPGERRGCELSDKASVPKCSEQHTSVSTSLQRACLKSIYLHISNYISYVMNGFSVS